MANKVSNEQMEALLEFLTEHPALAKGVGLGARSRAAIDRMWTEIANKLNAFGSGSSKSADRWKKYWADLKHKSKQRLTRRRQDAQGTGGGPSRQDDLSEIDCKILAIIGEQAVYGDTQYRVPVFNDEPSTSQPSTSSMPPIRTPEPLEGIRVVKEIVEFDEVELSNYSEQDPLVIQTAPLPAPPPPPYSVKSSVIMTPRKRRRLMRGSGVTSTNVQSRVDTQWVQELERRRRVEAEAKIANAVEVISQAVTMNAETNRMFVEIMGQLSNAISKYLSK